MKFVHATLAAALLAGATIAHAYDSKATIADLDARLAKIGAPKVDGSDPVGGRAAPALFFGERKINNNFDVVDAVRKAHGANATIFVKDGDEFVRVSTNSLTPEGKRGIGTQLARNAAYAAVSKGSDFCGKCYQLQFTGGSHNSSVDAGSKALLGKTMIVQAINNGGVGGDQFDLLVPGGGVGLLDACSKQWGSTDLGEQYGGFFLACQKSNNFDYEKSKACAKAKCDSVFANKPELRTGCEWFTGWFGAPDNPALTYKEVTCPDAITQNSGLKR